MLHTFILILLTVSSSLAHPSTDSSHHTNQISNEPHPADPTSVRSLGKECKSGSYSATCMKIEALAILERLSAKEELNILPGVSVVKEESGNTSNVKAEQMAAELARAYPGQPDERLDRFLLYRLGSYLDSHSVKLKLADSQAAEEARSAMGEVGDARKGGGGGGFGGGGGKKGGMGGLVAMAMMMKGTLMSLGMGALAMLAGKALMTALMSLLLSAIIGLKSLTSGGGKSTTYEIVAKPIVSHGHSHSSSHDDGGYGHSGYARSYEPYEPQPPTQRRR